MTLVRSPIGDMEKKKKKVADAISYVRLIMSYVRHNYLVRTTYYVVRTT